MMPVIAVIELEAMLLQVKTTMSAPDAVSSQVNASHLQFNERVHEGDSGRECRDAVGTKISTKDVVS